MKEAEIINLIQNGETKLFGKLYEKYIDEIYKFVYLKVMHKQNAEDIVSETFISAFNSIDSFKIGNQSNFRAWLYKIAYNKVKNYYKSYKESASIEDFYSLGYEENYVDSIDNKNKLHEVLQFIKGLNTNEKEVIIYRIWFDLSFKDIAAITKLSSANCRKIASRALKKIQSNLS